MPWIAVVSGLGGSVALAIWVAAALAGRIFGE